MIDRCRRYLKDRIAINQHAKRGLFALKAKLRSAQKQYWHKNKDLWTARSHRSVVYLGLSTVHSELIGCSHTGKVGTVKSG